MRKTIQVTPPNSLVLLLDYEQGQVPETLVGGLISATPSCIAIGTLSEMDGTTTIVLSDESGYQVPTGMSLVFEGEIKVSGDKLSLCTAENQVLQSIEVYSATPHVRIFVNNNEEPDQILIILSS